MVRVPKSSQTAAKQGKAELRILDFKTTWSEFQKPSQTAAKRSKAEQHILNLKTTWSEFQEPNQTTADQGKAHAVVYASNTWDLPMNKIPKVVLVIPCF